MKQTLFKIWLMLVCLMVGVGTTWAETVSFSMGSGQDVTSNSGATKSGISITATDGTSAANNWGGTTYVRLQAGGTFVITPSSATITSIVLNCTSGYEKTWSASTGSAPVVNTTAHTVTWSGSTTSAITLTNTASAQARVSSINVTYTTSGGGSTPTNYTVTVANDIANGTVTASPTSATAGSEISLTATPADGYEFGSWNVTNASTSAAITVTNNKFTMPAANVNVSATFNAVQGGGSGNETTVTFDNLGYASWGKEATFSGSTYDELSQTKSDVVFDYTRGSGSTYANTTSIRFYKDNQLKFTAPDGYNITSIVWTGSSFKDDVTTDVETCTSTTSALSWSGCASSVTFTRPSSATSYATLSSVSVTLEADATKYDVKYYIDGEEQTGLAQKVVEGGNPTAVTEPTKVGYTFDGWYEASDFSGDKIADVTSVTISADKNFYGRFNINNYTITYNNVDGATHSNPASYTIESATINLADASKDGYIFQGWFDNETFTGEAVTTIAQGSTGNKTFWAKWTEVPATPSTVTFNVGEHGTCETASVTEATVGAGVALPEVTANEGWVFKGWSTENPATVETIVSAGGDGMYHIIANTTLYAFYKVKPATPAFSTTGEIEKGTEVTISCTTEGANIYYTTNGDVPTAESAAYTEAITVSAAQTLKAIAILDGEQSEVATVAYTIAQHTAQFSINGVITDANNCTAAKGEAITFPADPEVDGVAFMGWATATIVGTQDAAPTMYKSANMGDGDITYYAVFASQKGDGETWNRVTTLAGIKAGTYVIINGGFYLPSTSTDSSTPPSAETAPDITEGIITGSVTDAMKWYLSPTGTANQFYIMNAGDNYLYETNANNGLRVGNTSDYWTFEEYTSGYFALKGHNNSRYCAKYENGNDWRSYGSKDATNYANDGKVELYKLNDNTSYSDYCTTVSVKTTPTLSFAEPTYDATMGDDFTAPTLTNEQNVTVSYTSSETGVATVNASTGAITLVAPGTTTITASFEGDEDYNEASASYQLVVAATPNKYSVTIETPENGTLTIKDGETVINNGDEVAEETVLTIEVEAADGYRFKNWGYKDGDAAWVGNMTTTFTHTMPSAPCSFKATFEIIPTYTINWSVNGVIVKTDENVRQGAALTTPEVSAINGKNFTGWVTTPTVDADATPEYVTPATPNTAEPNEITYYAVFADGDGEGSPSLTKITDVSQVEEGTYAIISYEQSYYLSNAKATTAPTLSTVTKNEGVIDISQDMLWTLSINAQESYILKSNASTNEEDLYLWGAPTNEGIRILTSSTKSNPFNTWELKSTNDYGLVLCHKIDNTTYRYLSTYSTNDWRNYTSTSATNLAANIYKYSSGNSYSGFTTIPEVTFTLAGTINFVANDGEGNYYATFSSDKITAFPTEPSSEVALYAEAVYIDNDGTIEKTDFYDDFESVNEDMDKVIIPANTGVLLHVFTTGDAVPPVNYEYTNAESEIGEYDPEFNMLVPCTSTGIFKEEADDNYYYKLAYGDNTNKTKLGFWWGAADGSGNFNVKAGGAVLVVPQSAGVRGFSFTPDGILTGVSSVSNDNDQDTIYSLQGQRMLKVQRGVNIVNGRKVIR